MKKLLLLMVVAIFATANSGCCRQHRLRNLFHRGAVCTPPVLSSVAPGPSVMPTVVASPITEGCSGGCNGGCNGNCNGGTVNGSIVNGGITEGTVLGGFIDETGGQAGCSSCQSNAGSSINYSGAVAPSTAVESVPSVLPSPTSDNET